MKTYSAFIDGEKLGAKLEHPQAAILAAFSTCAIKEVGNGNLIASAEFEYYENASLCAKCVIKTTNGKEHVIDIIEDGGGRNV